MLQRGLLWLTDMAADNGRTHEPSLRELTAELDGERALRAAEIKRLEQVASERDNRYSERAASAEKAIVKAENAQTVYNAGHNDLLRNQERLIGKFADKDDVNAISKRLAGMEGRIYGAAAAAGFIASLIAIALRFVH